ncbi:MAG: ThuA domain-containing protein [Parvularculaceae bacterium]
MSDGPIHAALIAGGQYHDIDHPRATLLGALGENPRIRTRVFEDYSRLDALDEVAFLVTYTCNVAPDAAGVARLEAFLARGGRWLALHGTNSILAQNETGRWYAPEDATGFMALLGSQFAAHPPIKPYRVDIADPDDPLAAGLEAFDVEGGDELYYMRLFSEVDVVMDAAGQGPARGFVERDWPDDARWPILYRKRVGDGEIVYCALGHRRGHYDMAPLIDYYPETELGAWETPAFMEIVRRGIAWGAGGEKRERKN